jgi:hypothetical protein
VAGALVSAPRRIGLDRVGFDTPPANLRTYPSVPAADDRELLERLRQERDDEPRGRSWEEQAADDAGKPLTGPL